MQAPRGSQPEDDTGDTGGTGAFAKPAKRDGMMVANGMAGSVSSAPPVPGREAVEPARGPLADAIRHGIAADGGWWPFDRFMHAALYTPGLGYYAGGRMILGASPASGSDFVTAPEMSPHFGHTLAAQVAQLLDACGDAGGGRGALWEFGAGSGALAEQLLDALGERVTRYTIVDVSVALQARQRERLARFGERVRWAFELPAAFERGVVIGNEVLDAMPVKRIAFDGQAWVERGVAVDGDGRFVDADRPTPLRPPRAEGFEAGAVTELHLEAQAFVATIAERLRHAAALFVDYGFPEAEYYHPQRAGGTLMTHRAHRAGVDVLADPGAQDITAHLDFTALALAAQDAGADVLGYTSQGRFLLNAGLIGLLDEAALPPGRSRGGPTPSGGSERHGHGGADLRAKNAAHRLIAEHEMGELFKVLLFARGVDVDAIGFAEGDRTHRL
jgi:SAM-dependent MidA family methyltransferase